MQVRCDCGEVYECADLFAGTEGTCKQCGGTFTIKPAGTIKNRKINSFSKNVSRPIWKRLFGLA